MNRRPLDTENRILLAVTLLVLAGAVLAVATADSAMAGPAYAVKVFLLSLWS